MAYIYITLYNYIFPKPVNNKFPSYSKPIACPWAPPVAPPRSATHRTRTAGQCPPPLIGAPPPWRWLEPWNAPVFPLWICRLGVTIMSTYNMCMYIYIYTHTYVCVHAYIACVSTYEQCSKSLSHSIILVGF